MKGGHPLEDVVSIECTPEKVAAVLQTSESLHSLIMLPPSDAETGSEGDQEGASKSYCSVVMDLSETTLLRGVSVCLSVVYRRNTSRYTSPDFRYFPSYLAADARTKIIHNVPIPCYSLRNFRWDLLRLKNLLEHF